MIPFPKIQDGDNDVIVGVGSHHGVGRRPPMIVVKEQMILK